MVRVGLAITALTTLGNSEGTQRTPAQVILIKLGQMAEGWTDFFIGNVIERPGRAENFKERSFLISDWSITFNIFEQN